LEPGFFIYPIKRRVIMLQGLAGLFAFAFLAWVMSENRKKGPIKTAFVGISIQLAVGVVLLKLSLFREFFLLLNRLVLSLEESTAAGTSLVFGYLAGGPLPFEETIPGSSFILAFRGLPLVLVVSALSSLLFYWKILPFVVKAFSW
jgi:concentrative nucleoside transporter, CNT family